MTKYTILLKKGSSLKKICKVFFLKEGGFCVTVPYNKANTATLTKLVYIRDQHSLGSMKPHKVPFSSTVHLSHLENKEVKFTHHLDGFVQFSGAGIKSGINADGSLKELV